MITHGEGKHSPERRETIIKNKINPLKSSAEQNRTTSIIGTALYGSDTSECFMLMWANGIGGCPQI